MILLYMISSIRKEKKSRRNINIEGENIQQSHTEQSP